MKNRQMNPMTSGMPQPLRSYPWGPNSFTRRIWGLPLMKYQSINDQNPTPTGADALPENSAMK